jgi:hypothetical protein
MHVCNIMRKDIRRKAWSVSNEIYCQVWLNVFIYDDFYKKIQPSQVPCDNVRQRTFWNLKLWFFTPKKTIGLEKSCFILGWTIRIHPLLVRAWILCFLNLPFPHVFTPFNNFPFCAFGHFIFPLVHKVSP